LPRRPRHAACEEDAPGEDRVEHCVLFIDDEANILRALQRLLRNEPCRVITASRGSEALEVLDRERPQVVVSDQRMPEISGVDLLQSVRQRHPDVIRILLTGYTEMNVAVEAINRGEIFRLVTKPWNDEELKATLRQAFDTYDLKSEIRRLNQITREQNLKLQELNRDLEGTVQERTKQLFDKHQELRIAYIQTIKALAEAVDAKDPYTRGHSERVGVYASKMGRELGLPRDQIERVYIAGLLHDLGKIGIRDTVIRKPDKLTAEEYEEIKLHPEIGARILQPVAFLSDVVPCVRHHHEWYDGSSRGYPEQIAGDRIPLPSRIILVSDTVEAMTSDRPYRKALPLDAVLAEVRRYSGSQYDPQCASAMLRLLERHGEAFLSKEERFDIHAFLEV
jgi:response regulator RpfG family c-di-GMP phosphodiesterase